MEKLTDYIVVWVPDNQIENKLGVESPEGIKAFFNQFYIPNYISDSFAYLEKKTAEGKLYTHPILQFDIGKYFDFPALKEVEFPEELSFYKGATIRIEDFHTLKNMLESFEIEYTATDILLGVSYDGDYLFIIEEDEIGRIDAMDIDVAQKMSTSTYLLLTEDEEISSDMGANYREYLEEFEGLGADIKS